MINIKKAYEVVMRHNTNMRMSKCNELENSFAFVLVPKDLAVGDSFVNSVVYMIDKKTCEYTVVHFYEVLGEPILRQFYDIKEFI